MTDRTVTPTTIDEYIEAAPAAVRPILSKIRRIFRETAPDAEEVISYRMPAFRRNGVIAYFAAFKQHIGLFPPVSGDAALEKAVGPYAGPKGNLRFPLDRPIPYELIKRIAKHSVEQDRAKASRRRDTRRTETQASPPSKPEHRPK
jgi:uncharacterized protein YdhG (YjbR/CyaY superfamily)